MPAIIITKQISIQSESAGAGVAGAGAATTLSVAEAGPPAGTPVPVTCEVVFVIGPVIVACMSIGTLQDAPAPSVTLPNDHPLPVNTALPALHV